MGEYVLSSGPSGLVVASQAGGDEAAASRALREYDPDLRLVPPGVLVQGEQVVRSDAYRVYKYVASDRPIAFVCGWWDDYGNALPFSVSGILEMVKRLDPNTRSEIVDADTENARLVRDRQKYAEQEFAEIADYFRDKLDDRKNSVLFRGKNLQYHRNKVRRETKTKEWRP